jgi:hypothetical protein
MSQDTNVLQISSKLAQMSENRQPKAHFCNTKAKVLKLLKLMPNQRV